MFDTSRITEMLRNAHTEALAILESLYDQYDPDWRWKAYLYRLTEDARQECYRAIDDEYDRAVAWMKENQP